MSEENVNNNDQLGLEDLDQAAGGWTHDLGGYDVDVRCPQCGQDDKAT